MARKCGNGTGGRCRGMKHGLYNAFFNNGVDLLSSSQGVQGYYVSEDGNGVGTQADPFGPSEFEAAISSIEAGANVFFKKGDTFELGDLVVPQNGITFGAYGSGADPIIIGSVDVGGQSWTQSGSYYYTSVATEPKWVFIDGVAARQGESDWIPIIASPGPSNQRQFTAATLNAFNTVQSLVGCKFRYKEFDFRLSYENSITAYNTGNGVVTATSNFVGAAVGMPIKLYGQLQFATQTDDWFWDSSTQRLYIRAASTPAGRNIRVCTKDYAFSLTDKDDVTFDGLEFTQYYQAAIYGKNTDRLELKNLDINNIRTNATYLEGNSTDMSIHDLEVSRCGLNGIFFRSTFNTAIYNFNIHDIGLESNIGWPLTNSTGDILVKMGGTGIVGADDASESQKIPSAAHIYDGTITDVGYQGISQYGPNWLYERLIITRFDLKWTDGGGIHTFFRNDLGGASETSGTIRNCVISGGVGNLDGISNATSTGFVSGIYLDNGSHNFTIEDCVTYNNTAFGFIANWNVTNSTITDNVFFDNGLAQVFFYENQSASASPNYSTNRNNILTGNKLSTSIPGSRLVAAVAFQSDGTTFNTSYNPFSGGDSDNNTYINSSATTVGSIQTAGIAGGVSGTYTNYTLTTWRTYTSDDASSTEKTNFSKEALFYVNTTSSTVNPSIGSGWEDINGNAITTVSVPAYFATLYIRTASMLLADSFIAANGTAVTGRSPQIGPVPGVTGTPITDTNRLYSSGGGGICTYNLGTPDVKLSLTSFGISADNFATYFRYTNIADPNNRLLLLYTGGAFVLREYNNSATPTVLGSYTYAAPYRQEHRIRIEVDGSSVVIYLNNVAIISATTALLTGNIHGVAHATTRYTDYIYANPL